MKESLPFQLEVLSRERSTYGLALQQRFSNGQRRDSSSVRQVARIWGPAMEAILDRVLEAVRGNGFRAIDLRPGRKAPFALAEETYYWFAKCSRPELSCRACRALHIMLAEE